MQEFETLVTNGFENTLSAISFGVGAVVGFGFTLRTLPSITVDYETEKIHVPDNLQRKGIGTSVGILTLIGAVYLKYLEKHPEIFLSDPSLDVSKFNLTAECCLPVNFMFFASGVAFGSVIARITSRVVSEKLIKRDKKDDEGANKDELNEETNYEFHDHGFLK